MIARFLAHFGLALVDLDLVARALAADLLRTHEVAVLDSYGTQQELRRQYALLATQTGLPIHAQRQVAQMAWQYVAAAQEAQAQTPNRKEFSFYA
jgi:predicted kinase